MNPNKFTDNLSSMNSENIELYSPKHLVDLIIPYLDKTKTYWAPFDLESSNFVRHLRNNGYKIIHSHYNPITKVGQNFLTYKPKEHFDAILSNPPFKNKAKWVKRAMEFKKPFAFVFPVMWMNDIGWNKINDIAKFELIIPDRRISFDGTTKTCAFKSVFFTSGYNIGK